MSDLTMDAIKEAISHLPYEEKETLASWLNASTMDDWDRQIEQDFSSGGRGAGILEEFRSEARATNLEPLTDGLNKRRKSR